MNSTPAKIRLVIADDHPIVREGVKALLAREPDMLVLGEGSDGLEILEQIELHRPDIALIDLRMPGKSGADLIAEICLKYSDTQSIILTSFSGDEDIFRALRSGAKAYLLKDSPPEELLAAIRQVFTGGTYISPYAASSLAERARYNVLTDRELDVLRAMVTGDSNKEIAFKLHITEGTVKAHVNRILQKLSVSGRTEAVSQAFRRGLI